MRYLLVLLLVACGDDSSSTQSDASVGEPDAAPDAAPPACDVTKPFGAGTAVAGVNSGAEEAAGWMSADELSLYFTRCPTGNFNACDIYVATRASVTAAFGTPTSLANVSTGGANEYRAAVTADGLQLFAGTTGVGVGMFDIGVATRADTASEFSALTAVPVVNGASGDGGPWISEDGLELYFHSDRTASRFQLFRSTRASTADNFGDPVLLSELSGTTADLSPIPSKDGLEIFWESIRGAGSNNIWRATRATTSEAFSNPMAVTELNTNSVDAPTWLSADRCRLLYTSNMGGNFEIKIAVRPL